MSESAPETPPSSTGRGILKHIGPGLVTACVVIGPGSILTSTNVGAANGYALGWIVLVACFFMMVYTTLAAKLGVVTQESTCNLVAKRAGRLLAVLLGVSVFFISAAFQYGNNLGVHLAFDVFIDFKNTGEAIPSGESVATDASISTDETVPTVEPLPKVLWVLPIVLFNGIALAFLFGFRNLYKVVERLMATFVAVMLIAFAINLAFGKPNVIEMLMGLVPLVGGDSGTGASLGERMREQAGNLDLAVMGLVATTFVISAAFYQSYLVRFRGWKVENLKDGLLDARVSATIMALITLMLMFTAGTVLRGQVLRDVKHVAESLEPAFGPWGQIIFCVGLFSAAYSSFLVNSMIGGFILADGFGLGSTPEDRWPRIMTAAVLLTGMGVAAVYILADWDPVLAIIAAQAMTVLAAPLVAGTIWWLTNRVDVMGEQRNGTTANVLAGLGFLLLLGIACNTVVNSLPAKIQQLRESQEASESNVHGESIGQSETIRDWNPYTV